MNPNADPVDPVQLPEESNWSDTGPVGPTSKALGNFENTLLLSGNLPGWWVNSAWAVLDAKGKVIDANDSLLRWLQTTHAKVQGKDWKEVMEDHRAGTFPFWEEALSNLDSFFEGTFQISRRSQSCCYSVEVVKSNQVIVVRIGSILPKEGGVQARTEFGRTDDLVSRNLFLRLLRAEAQLDNLVHHWPGVLFSQRADLSFSFVSPRIEEFTGVSVDEWRNPLRLVLELIHEADAEMVQQHLKNVLKTEKGLALTYRIRHTKTGRITYILEHRKALKSPSGLLLGYEGLWLDVSRQTIAERRLSSAAWKETLAVLTMGLAHDFSNTMAGILALSEDFLLRTGQGHEFNEGLEMIKSSTLQASQLVQRILNLHHGKTGEKNYYDLNELTKDLAELIRKVIPKRIAVHFAPDDKPLPAYLDLVEFRQVVINLILNAVDAMPEHGKVTLETLRSESLPMSMAFQGMAPRPPLVILRVSDNGRGIPRQNLESIFDPFFTTKATNKGSGLGLYNARLFVEKHGGGIAVNSEEGHGTTFDLCLPESDFTESETPRTPNQQRRTLLLVGLPGQATDYLAEVLRQGQYSVVVAPGEESALQWLNSPNYQFNGVIAQVTAQVFCPRHMFERLGKRFPQLKVVLLILGCNQDEIDYGVAQAADLILTSDLPARELLDRLERVWDARE